MKGFSILSMCLAATFISASPTYKHRSNATEKRITYGHDVDIQNANYYIFFICGNAAGGATLVSNNRVITAAHCVHDCKPNQVSMFLGMNSRSELGSTTKFGASNFYIHPKYDRNRPIHFDIAVVYVNGWVQTNDRIGTLSYGAILPQPNSYVYKVGYGMMQNGHGAEKLQGTWNLVLGYEDGDIMVNDGYKTSACAGDSGGPVIYDKKLVGVISGVEVVNDVPCRARNFEVAIGHPDVLSFVRSHVG